MTKADFLAFQAEQARLHAERERGARPASRSARRSASRPTRATPPPASLRQLDPGSPRGGR